MPHSSSPTMWLVDSCEDPGGERPSRPAPKVTVRWHGGLLPLHTDPGGFLHPVLGSSANHHTHTHTHTHLHTHIHMRVHTPPTCTHSHTYIHTCIREHTHAHIYMCAHAHARTHTHNPWPKQAGGSSGRVSSGTSPAVTTGRYLPHPDPAREQGQVRHLLCARPVSPASPGISQARVGRCLGPKEGLG